MTADLQRELARLVKALLGDAEPARATLPLPRVELRESEHEFCVAAELPGMCGSDVDLRLTGDVLSIRGEMPRDGGAEGAELHIGERWYGRFERQLRLPCAPDPAQVQAEFDRGVLRVRLRKRADAAPEQRIEVHDTAPGALQPRADTGAVAIAEVEARSH